MPADIAGHDCLGYAYRTRAAERTLQFTGNGDTHSVVVNYRLEANDGTALKAAALAGAGIAIAAEDTLRDAIEDGRFVRILPDYEPPSRPLHLLYARDRRQTPKLARFIALAVAYFQPKPGLKLQPGQPLAPRNEVSHEFAMTLRLAGMRPAYGWGVADALNASPQTSGLIQCKRHASGPKLSDG